MKNAFVSGDVDGLSEQKESFDQSYEVPQSSGKVGQTSKKVASGVLSRDIVTGAYGASIDLGPTIISINLNLYCLRGAAALDRISIVSAPDVYDPEDNLGGTQRPLDRKRTADLFSYALGTNVDQELPRAFPEVLINVRDKTALQIYDLDDVNRVLDFDSWAGLRDVTRKFVGVRVPLQFLQFPKPKIGPQISRVDGNHRLSGMDSAIHESLGLGTEYPNAPFVTFSLYVGLTTEEERRLFNVVNSKQRPVEAALLETQSYELLSDEEKILPKNLPSHLAHILSHEGGAFYNATFGGGDKTGSKNAGLKHILKINTLRSTMETQVKSLPTNLRDALTGDAGLLSVLVNNYWLAVKYVFPEAWDDKKNYILMQTIGLTALAKLWGEQIVVNVLKDSQHKGKQVSDFAPYLEPIRAKNLFNKNLTDSATGKLVYEGVAGIAGAEKVLKIIGSALTDLNVMLALAKATHNPDIPLSEKVQAN